MPTNVNCSTCKYSHHSNADFAKARLTNTHFKIICKAPGAGSKIPTMATTNTYHCSDYKPIPSTESL